MTSNAPKREENQGFKGKTRTEEDLSSSDERAPLERRRNDEVESESDWGLSSQQLEMGDSYPIALSSLV